MVMHGPRQHELLILVIDAIVAGERGAWLLVLTSDCRDAIVLAHVVYLAHS